jgi:osmotically-inducible protein OsmY
MISKKKLLAMVPAMVFGLALSVPALAQETASNPDPSASESMNQAGKDTASAATNIYQGTVTALDDTRITAAVKTSLAAAKDLRSGQIHVTTTAGVVTLRGVVHDATVVARAETIAKNASGVSEVKNELEVSSSVPKD